MSDCVFCGIAAGDIPSDVVYQDDEVIAFRDIAPAAPTHVLIVPKRHIGDVRDLDASDDPVAGALLRRAASIAASEGIEPGGYRLIFNVGRDAGQTVFHLHLHLVGGKNLGGVA